MKLPSWRHKDRAAAGAVEAEPVAAEPQTITLDLGQLRQMSAVFAAPRWLRDIGVASWLLVGLALLIVGLVALLAITSVIAEPVLIGLVLATVSTPVVSWLQRKGVPRVAGALLVLLGFVVLGVVILVMVLGGIVAQGDEIKSSASAAADKAQSWLEEAGVDSSGAASANQNVSEGTSSTISTFVKGLGAAVQGVTALVFFVVFLGLQPPLPAQGRAGVPELRRRSHGRAPERRPDDTGNVIASLRRYFGGVTIVAAFNAIVVGIGALVLDVPLAGTIAVVTFVTAYIPFIGAFVSGAFAVVLALGSQGTETALIMLVIVLLANGLLQNIVQPIAFGATLRMNPLLVLVTTIGFGAIFGMARPHTRCAAHVGRDPHQRRSREGAVGGSGGERRRPRRAGTGAGIVRMSVQVAAENPSPVLPFGDPSRKRRLVKVVAWLVGIALAVVLLNLLGIDILGWLQDLWDQIKDVPPGYIVSALLFQTGQTVFAGVSYYGILNAAYPGEVQLAPIVTAYAVGVSMNDFLPANIGTFVTLLMFVAIIPSCAFPARSPPTSSRRSSSRLPAPSSTSISSSRCPARSTRIWATFPTTRLPRSSSSSVGPSCS